MRRTLWIIIAIIGLTLSACGDSDDATPTPRQTVRDNPLSRAAPLWSPDGSQILYTAPSGEMLALWIMSGTGENPRLLTGNLPIRFLAFVAWTPDGQSIVFSGSVNDRPDVYLLMLDTGDIINLTQSLGVRSAVARLSPDGRFVAITQWRDEEIVDFYRLDIQSRELIHFTSEQAFLGSVHWSPDSRFMSYRVISTRPIESDFILIDNETLEKTTLFTVNGAMGGHKWSPNGEQIAFALLNGGPFSEELWLYDIGEDTSTLLTDEGRLSVYDIIWSPDGQQIVYTTVCDESLQLYSVNMVTRDVRNLTGCDSNFSASASFSPDGTQILFQSDRGGTSDIWIMNADGSNPRPIPRTN